MTLRITPFPEPRAVPADPDPEARRQLAGLGAALPGNNKPEKERNNGDPRNDPALEPILKRLTRLRTTPPATAAAVAPAPFPPIAPDPFPPVEPPAETPADVPLEAPPEDSGEVPAGKDPEPSPESVPEATPAPESAQPRFRKRDPSSPADEAEALEDALAPMIEKAVSSALYGPKESLHTYLEPMLRQTVRRAIAEQLESSRLFSNASLLSRLLWRLEALVSSKTYDEIVFDRTHRYQVEEIYLFSRDLRRLLSYASHDPAQHGSPRKVRPTVRVLRARLGDLRGKDEHAFDLPLGRLGLVREGKFTLLVAVLRGRSNALIRADLDFLQFQIEERYGRQLRDPQNVFMHTLQPILEAGLLIQAPPAEQSGSQ